MITDLPSQMLPVDSIHPDQLQPRRSFDLAQHEALKADIEDHGLLQPILVRRNALKKDFIIIFGERRWRCAQELGWKEIPARVIDRELTPAEIIVIQWLENESRESLNPVDCARSLARLQSLLKCSREELAEKLHRSPASICRSFKLLELPPEVQELVETGRLPTSIAAELHRCSTPALQKELAHKASAGEMTRDEVTNSIRSGATPKSSTTARHLTFPLGNGISLKLPNQMSLKDCEIALTGWLRQLRSAKKTMADLSEFATWLKTGK